MTVRLPTLCTLLFVALLGLNGCSRKSAEEKGAAMAQEKLDLAKGVGGVLEQHGGKVGETLASGIGNTLVGVGKGFEKSFGRTIVSSPALEQAGIKVSKVQDAHPTGEKPVHGIDVYVVADKGAAGTLRMIALDRADNEVARTALAVSYASGDGRYETLALDERVQLINIEKLSFDFVPGAAPAAK